MIAYRLRRLKLLAFRTIGSRVGQSGVSALGVSTAGVHQRVTSPFGLFDRQTGLEITWVRRNPKLPASTFQRKPARRNRFEQVVPGVVP